jgi:AhpD family alkylhydroperoxidase
MSEKSGEMEECYRNLKRSFAPIIMFNKDYVRAFMELEDESYKEGALSTKTKRLMSVSISVILHCKSCIAFHVKEAMELGATRKEIMESALLAGMMGGGAAAAHIQYVIDACDEFGAK